METLNRRDEHSINLPAGRQCHSTSHPQPNKAHPQPSLRRSRRHRRDARLGGGRRHAVHATPCVCVFIFALHSHITYTFCDVVVYTLYTLWDVAM